MTCFAYCLLAVGQAKQLDTPVYANELPPYAIAKTDEAYFCSTPSEATGLFAIPQTYGVEVLGKEGDYYRVRYAQNEGDYISIDGYCLSSKLTPQKTRPDTLWLSYTITVTYSADVGTSPLPLPEKLQVQASFYGNYRMGGAEFSYVYCQGKFGYVSGAVPYPRLEVTAPPVASTAEEKSTATLPLWLGGCLVALCIGVTASTLKPHPRSKKIF